MTITYDPVELAQTLIRIPSVSPDKGQVLTLIESHLTSLGFQCHQKTFHGGGTYSVPNLYAKIGTEGGSNFCFAGHTDVVPPGTLKDWIYPPFQGAIANGLLYGRGAADMKGAIASFICALQKFLSQNTLQGSISLLITGDEEAEAVNGTQQALKWIDEKGETLDACLIGEATSVKRLGDTLKVGRRGSLSGVLRIKGKQGHVAYPHLAKNPLSELVKILWALNAQEWKDGSAFFQPSNLEITSIDTGNKAGNVIPETTQASFNIRFNPNQNLESLQNWVRDVCKNHGQDYEIDWVNKGSPFYTEDGLLRQVSIQAIKDITSFSPQISTSGGTSDGRYIHAYCPVVELGVCNATIHQTNEHVALEDLKSLRDIYAHLLTLFFKSQ